MNEKVYLGGGCFWCTEAVFQKIKGVTHVTSGYMGGDIVNPTYAQVSGGNTGHVEVVEIVFDKNLVAFKEILKIFFAMHDPTQLDRQGSDIGSQYRSVIFYTNEQQRNVSIKVIQTLNKNAFSSNKIVTKVEPATQFFKAEAYHQNFFVQNPSKAYCQLVINPKIKKLYQKFPSQTLNGD